MTRKCIATGKLKFTQLEAMLAVARVGVEDATHRHNREIKRPRRYYVCEFGDHCHLTSQDKNVAVD